MYNNSILVAALANLAVVSTDSTDRKPWFTCVDYVPATYQHTLEPAQEDNLFTAIPPAPACIFRGYTFLCN